MREIQKGTTFTRNEATRAQKLIDLGCLQQCKIHLECEPCILCTDLRSDLRNYNLKVSKYPSWWREKRHASNGSSTSREHFWMFDTDQGRNATNLNQNWIPIEQEFVSEKNRHKSAQIHHFCGVFYVTTQNDPFSLNILEWKVSCLLHNF